MPPELLERLKANAAATGESVSAWLSAAAESRLRDANMDKLIADYEAEHGEITEAELEAVRAKWPE